MAGRKGRGTNAWFISDRSGFRYPYSESVIEPGTGYLIHKSESDGEYNLVDHPANHISRYAKTGDPFPIENPRGRQTIEEVPVALQTPDGDLILTPDDKIIEV